MPSADSAITPEQFTNFGDLLKFLRRRAGLTQQELSIAVGYSESHISRLEKNQRIPDTSSIAARFVPALELGKEKEWVARLLELATAPHAAIEMVPQERDADPRELPPHNLPFQFTSFVGREQQIAEITRFLRPNSGLSKKVRLLTLTGAGGSGKTRLALHVATELLPEFPDGIFFVDLAPVIEAVLVLPAIAQALKVTPVPGLNALDSLQEHLAVKRVLVILDNFEQVPDAASDLMKLLNAVPTLTLLVTSRVLLHVTSEHEYGVPPLSLPNPDSSDSDELQKNEAVALFIQRAQVAQTDFQLSENTVRAIAEICVRLDGLPLAIELAAVRTRVLSPQELLTRLNRRFALLTGGARDFPARQKTLRNTIDWSYHLLSPAEQKLFTRLGVFVGGWALDAAEKVCNVEGALSGDLIDCLQGLIDHNLVRQSISSEGVTRFRMLETIREYSLEQLQSSGEHERLAQQHAEYYFALVDRVMPKTWHLGFDKETVVAIRAEKDNIRAALGWSEQTKGRAQMALRLAETADFISDYTEQANLLERVLALASAEGGYDLHTQARVLTYLAEVKSWLGDLHGAEVSYAECYSIFERQGDSLWAASSLERFGWVARERGETDLARARLEKSFAMARTLNNHAFLFVVTNTLGETMTMQGDFDAARQRLEEILPLERRTDEWYCLGWTLNHLGHVAQLEGDFDQAARYHEESMESFRKTPYSWGKIESRHCLGETALAQGDAVIAASYLVESLRLAHNSRLSSAIAWCLAGLAGVAVLNEEPERAAQLWGAAEQLRQRLGVREGPATHDLHEQLITQAREQLGEVAFAKAEAAGGMLTMTEAVALAMQSDEPRRSN